MRRANFTILILLLMVALTFILARTFNAKKASVPGEGRRVDYASVIFSEAREFENKGKFSKAKDLYNKILESASDEKTVQRVHKEIMALNVKMLFSAVQGDNSVVHTVVQGDTLGKLARQYGTTVGLIKRSNGLSSDIIRIGGRLKISTADYSVTVDRSENLLTLREGDSVLKTYRIATGLVNSSPTPIGTFKVINKLKDPVWYKTGAVVPSGSPENILGTRWLGLSVSGYGIHGTTIPESIGTHATAGCVRMLTEEVEELYDILPIGAEVTIVE